MLTIEKALTVTSSLSPAQSKTLSWTILASLLLLLFGAIVGSLGATLAFISLLVITLGVIAIIRGGIRRFKISNRRSGASVLVAGVYLFILGVVASLTVGGPTPAVAAVGDSCEIAGTVNELEAETLYCTPSASNVLTWASETDFKAYQTAKDEKHAAEIEEESKVISERHEEEIAAAEKRADDAEAELQQHKDEAKAEKEAAAEEEEAAAAVAGTEAEEEQHQREQEATQNAPATEPAPAPNLEPESDVSNSSSTYYKNCTAARDAGAAPVHRGDPGYGTHLDRDGDGIGCE